MNLQAEQEKMRQRWEEKVEQVVCDRDYVARRLHRNHPVRDTFYAINVLPRDGKRFKFGFSCDLNKRLEQHRVIAPDLIVVRAYPCHPANEKTVIEWIMHWPGVVWVGDEVADVADPVAVMRRLDATFKERNLTQRLPKQIF